MRANATTSVIGLVLSASFVVVSGCSKGGDFGESITVSQEKRLTLHAGFAEGKPLYFPKDRPFNVRDAQRASSGKATADSAATETGTAHCRAAATGVGTAKAEFQLGQVVFLPSDKPIEATVVFDIDCAYKVNADATDTTKPEDKLGLKVYIRDSDNRLLKKKMLTDLETLKGPNTFTGRLAPSFDVTLEPSLAYHLVLAGIVEVSGTEQSVASAEIEIRSLHVELLPKGWSQ